MTVRQAAGSLPARAIGRQLVGRRAGKAALWLGLLLVFALSSLTTDRPGPAPTQRNWVFGRLNHEHSFGQTFVAAPGELVAVRVLLFANSGDRDDSITLRLRYADGDWPDLAVVTLPLRALGRRDWTTFDIPPLTLGLTSSLRLDLAVPTLPPTDWVTVMAGRDTYSAGHLLVDGTPHLTADLAFQPVYRRRWFDWLLPITRIAHSKPGPLGWPPMYAMLAYSCCVTVASLILSLWRGARRS
jgi:hypothetical protein